MLSENERTASGWLKETQKGYIRIAVLILLSRKPYHGYEIMKEVKERTMGFWSPTAGGVYPVLQDLEESGYLRGEWEAQKKRKRKKYKITKAGRAVLEHALAKESQLANSIRDLFKDYLKDVLNVETDTVQATRVPNLFSVFLEERKEKPEDTLKILEGKRAQFEEMIKKLQKELARIDEKMAQLERGKMPR